MVEALQMFLFLFKSKYRRKCAWFSPFLCSVLIVLLFCHGVLTMCTGSSNTCINTTGNCTKNGSCECLDGWQGPECQYCGGKINLTTTSGFITDGPFNYSVSTQCTWVLIPPRIGSTIPTIRVRLESFATECGWDHLYVYDGDSVRAERLLAVYSGVMHPEDSGWSRQVIARSGSVLLHFFSDDAYAMEGFNITFAAYSCPSNDYRTNCSNHGDCEDGTCKCEQGWTGVACDEPICPDDCNAAYGAGTCTPTGCVCSPSRSGDDCSLSNRNARWEWAWRETGEGRFSANGEAPSVAGAVLVEYKGDIIRVGGEAFADAPMLYRYEWARNTWQALYTHGTAPASRASHSAVLYKDTLVVFGGSLHTHRHIDENLAGLEGRAGDVTNEVWKINLDEMHPTWYNVTPTCPPHKHSPFKRCGGLAVSGHSAVLVEMGPAKQAVMLVFFGHSPHYGYLHIVQEYYIEENMWSIAQTKGWAARAGFGHSAVLDPLSGKVYVHGGLVSESEATQAPSAALFEYDYEQRMWRPLPSAPSPRYLHAAVFVSPGIMVVLGGNAHNDSAAHATPAPHSASCYCSQAYTYDVRCRTWRSVPAPRGSARAAHSAVLTSRGALFYGGFDGRLRSDALVFKIGSKCSTHTDETSCLKSAEINAVACGWSAHQQICLPLEKVGWNESLEGAVKTCETEPLIDESLCRSSWSCGACVAAGCAWCGACLSRAEHCARRRHAHPHTATNIEECGINPEGREACSRYHSCAACHAHHHYNSNEEQRLCYWDYDTAKCKPANTSEDHRTSASAACGAPCSTFKTCNNCTAEECIWCASAATCVDKNAYGASFPLGGCRVWATANGSGGCGAGSGCSAHQDCGACLREPACGWCAAAEPGGRGECRRGGSRGDEAAQCPAERWHFTFCPRCQCNGHSVCDELDRCIQPCGGRAAGDHCQLCAAMHHGEPRNGNYCQECECNSQALACDPSSGRCFCSTKGLAGEKCDKCDNTNHYHADAFNKGACYYDLAVDYQFTFNLSKKEDRHLSAINFRNAPVKPDVDADFSITCSAHARMNLTVRTRSDPSERSLFSDVNCTNFRYKFAKADHQFGVEDNVTLTTFFVYVYDFKPPLWIQISFSQYPKLNLQQFFITFSSCFLLLLLLAAALWKIKQKYDMYRRRQRLFVEMEQMASRPFSQVCVELERVNTQGGAGVPAPVALEPCAGGRAAVLSLLVRLPTGATGRAPPLGGLAVASALVTLGHAPPATKARHAR